jgi:NAD(P)-dependent dehydrogenase (short-subunit alcohol dehydrogenase family)
MRRPGAAVSFVRKYDDHHQQELAMRIENSVALVTGANRGLGAAFVRALHARGARKVYAASRDGRVAAGAVPLRLDVTSADDIAAAAAAAGDVTGIARGGRLLDAEAAATLQAELATNVFGPLALAQAFAPILARNGGGAVVNVLSVLSWVTLPQLSTYSMSKAAAWAMTNGLRGALAAQGTSVTALHVGYMDTDMARHIDGPKSSPDDVARLALDGVEAGLPEVLADAISEQVKRGLSADRAPYLEAR